MLGQVCGEIFTSSLCVFSVLCAFPSLRVFFLSSRSASSSARSVVIISSSVWEALTTTGTLLELEQIKASPRSNWVMARTSLRVSFKVSWTCLLYTSDAADD